MACGRCQSHASLAGLDVGRQALLLDLLTELAQCQEPEAVWAVLATRLKWLLDFERCDVAVVNPDHQTYHLRTVFDARPAVPHVDEAQVPLAAGLVGVLLLRGTPSLLLDLARDPMRARSRDPWFEAGALASVLTVRVHVQGQTVGALHLGRVRAGGYGAVDIALRGAGRRPAGCGAGGLGVAGSAAAPPRRPCTRARP